MSSEDDARKQKGADVKRNAHAMHPHRPNKAGTDWDAMEENDAIIALNMTLSAPTLNRRLGRAYVQALETRVKAAEALLAKAKAEKSPGVQLISNAIHRLNSPFPIPHTDDLTFADIDESFRALAIDDTAAQGFQGKSSGAMLVKAAVDLRKKNSTVQDLSASFPSTSKPFPHQTTCSPKTTFWPRSSFLYFENVNTFLPLFHRPTFESAVNQHLHLSHSGFAKTVLLVCAVGARYSTDPRVSIPDTSPVETAGWKYYDQVKLSGHLVRTHPTLYDLQAYCASPSFLAAEFLDCTSSPRTCWTLVGFGMRLGQDIGFHRFKIRNRLTFEQELEKRASWVLYLFDTQISTALGRCIALQSHDFDIEMPIICDDEYWAGSPANGTPMFTQPADKPSQIAYFKCMLDLNRILSFSCKILYSTNRSKTLIGLGDDKWEEQVVIELDSALNKWFETIPAHLRWNPDNLIQSDVFFDQSAVLYCTYYHTRIIIHRPFIPAMRRASKYTHLPSLAICNTAARACSHVAEVQQRRRPNNPLWFSQTPLFTAGIVLLLNIWGGSGTGTAKANVAEKDLADVHRCMAVLDAQRRLWPSAGTLLDTLQQLVAVDRPLANAQPTQIQLAPPSIPKAATQPDINDSQPFFVPFAPPDYDPALETAPPDYLAADAWHGSSSTSQSGSESFDDSQLFQDHVISTGYQDPSFDTGFKDPSSADTGFGDLQGFNANAYGLDQYYNQDVNMELDTNTVALWSQAPTGFGVADWDIYLGRFVDETQVGPMYSQY
ncbi:Zn(2)-C6 fungal-type domain-containing protein [Mycena sanguinolenta]|uniref:Zn(2)-C6 fungal-type domain-containing protein n=1 Tax=Mycena sanguinolenta TaxID=230812 RepID=A0A8H6YXD8_9AGAR|nr:Zn(2)-C6 fungal-type domain-containing protein [Mycena sanguinolenta]